MTTTEDKQRNTKDLSTCRTSIGMREFSTWSDHEDEKERNTKVLSTGRNLSDHADKERNTKVFSLRQNYFRIVGARRQIDHNTKYIFIITIISITIIFSLCDLWFVWAIHTSSASWASFTVYTATFISLPLIEWDISTEILIFFTTFWTIIWIYFGVPDNGIMRLVMTVSVQCTIFILTEMLVRWRPLKQLWAKFTKYCLDKILRKVSATQEEKTAILTYPRSLTQEGEIASSPILEKEIGPEGGKLQIGRHEIDLPPGALDSAKMIKIEVMLENDVLNLPNNFILISHLIECCPGNIHFNKMATFTIPVWFRVFHKSPPVFAFIYKHSQLSGWECVAKLELGHSDTISFGCSHFCKFGALMHRNDAESGKFFIDHLLCANRFMFISRLCVSEPTLIENLIEWAKQSGYKILYPPGNEIPVKLGQRTKISLTSKEPARYYFEPDSQSFLVKEFPTQRKTKSISFLLQNIDADPAKIVKLVYQVGHDKYFVATDIREPPKVYPSKCRETCTLAYSDFSSCLNYWSDVFPHGGRCAHNQKLNFTP